MKPLYVIIILILFILAMDLYAFRGIGLLADFPLDINSLYTWIYWAITLFMLAALTWAGTRFRQMRDPVLFNRIMGIMGIFLMLYVPKIFFNGWQFLGDIFQWLAGIIIAGHPEFNIRKFFLFPGAFMGVVLFLGFGYGMIWGKTNIKLFRETIRIPGLPAAFEGMKIIQLSDFHLAGFHNHPDYIRRIVERTNELKPDLLLFTGDMVHNFAEELDPFILLLNRLSAPLGKYAILGNHDYGRYYNWGSNEAQAANLDRVKEKIREAGFDLLLNENRKISLKGESIDLIGVENWGKPPFPQDGDLKKAMLGLRNGTVRILMSHDPSHWDLQVKNREPVVLTLSGHTHGLQFGFEIGKFRWSPSRWQYREWAGLYRENGQYLYVNRGLGFTGFPGRVGIRPEITLITLSGTDSPASG